MNKDHFVKHKEYSKAQITRVPVARRCRPFPHAIGTTPAPLLMGPAIWFAMTPKATVNAASAPVSEATRSTMAINHAVTLTNVNWARMTVNTSVSTRMVVTNARV